MDFTPQRLHVLGGGGGGLEYTTHSIYIHYDVNRTSDGKIY